MIKKYIQFCESLLDHTSLDSKVMEFLFPGADSINAKNFVKSKYVINADLSVDILDKGVDIVYMGIAELPFKFGEVGGYFICSGNELKSLVNSPKSVTGSFECSKNHLESLKYAPNVIGGSFYADNNLLETLDCEHTEVFGNFGVYDNLHLKSLKKGPRIIRGQAYDFRNCDIRDVNGFPELYPPDMEIFYTGNPVAEILDLFEKNISECIPLLNEWEVIDASEMTVSYLRISEVYEALGMIIPTYQQLKDSFIEYELID